jgi:hypothetical protein
MATQFQKTSEIFVRRDPNLLEFFQWENLSASPQPPPVLSPQVGTEGESSQRWDAEAKIQGAEKIVKQVDQKTLAEEQQEIFSTIQSFLSKAREALSLGDFLRAFNLAEKAQILAEGLLSTPR